MVVLHVVGSGLAGNVFPLQQLQSQQRRDSHNQGSREEKAKKLEEEGSREGILGLK